MDPELSDANGPDERLYAVLLEFLESADRGAPPEPADLLARYPELAPELGEFLDTWVRVQDLTAPIRSASQALREAVRSGHLAAPEGDGHPGAAAPAPDGPGDFAEPGGSPGDQPRETIGGEVGWLGRWLRRHPPPSAEHYPFLSASPGQGEIGRLGPYRLLEVIGSGGMGVVFRGDDVPLRRPVAVKVLRAELAADPAFRERFLREARSAAAVDHEHVIAVYHVGEDGGIPFLGMQWLRGMSLEELLRRGGRLDAASVVRLGRQIAMGLAAAHGQGLLHRDIKPANLWVELAGTGPLGPEAASGAASKGRVKILDFGLARAADDEGQLTHSGTAVGTPAYMAPEQAAGGTVDARCDLFGLGVVLYRMCTGQLPFPGRHPAAGAGPPVQPPPSVRDLNPAVPPELADLVTVLLARDPADRPSTAVEVGARLRVLEGRRAAAHPEATPPAPPVPGPSGGRGWRRATAVAALALAALLPLGYLFGGTVLRFATNRGEVVIAVDDPDTDVTVKEGGAVIEDRKGHRRITLAAGEHELEITVRDSGGGELHFFTKSFVLRRGGREVINVRQELGPVAAPVVPQPIDADRAGAEWALALGANTTVRVGNREWEVRSVKELPAAEFRLIAVDLSDKAVNDAGLVRLGALADLRSLQLSRTPVEDRALAQLSGLKGLRTLAVDQTKVTDAGLTHLRDLTGLQELDVASTAVSNAGLSHLETLTNLRFLNLSGTKVTDAGLAHLRPLKELEILYLNSLQLTGAGLAHLEGMKKLRHLVVPGTPLTDAGLVHLRDLPALEELALDATRVTDAGLPLLEACKSLRAINVGGPGVTDAGLESLGRMTNLRQLGLFGSRVTDAGLAHLDKLTNLEILNLSGLPVTEAGLAHVAGATRLYRLELSGTRVNDASIKGIIAGNWPLNYLGLRDTRVSGNGYALLKTTYPDARISWSEPNQVVALLVLAAGGTVQVRVVGRTEERSVKEARDLPGDYFIVTRYRLSGAGKVPEDLPAKLAALTDPKLDGLEGADFSGGPCDLDRLKVLLPRTITDLTLANTRVNDDNLALLQVFRLRRLSLEGCPVSGRGLAHLKAVPELAQSLADLSLARTQFSDAHTGILRAFPNLRRLDVSGCPVRGPGLTTLKELPELRELILACPTLTDLFAEELGGLRRVERLSLAGSSLTDAGLKHLGGLAQLRDLDLRGTKVTAEGVAALRKALPACDIKADSPGAR